MVIDSNGKIVVGGYSYNGSNYDFIVLRYNTNGTLDTANFNNPNGYRVTPIGSGDDRGFDVAIQPSDGYIVVAGETNSLGPTDWDYAVARYDTVGNLDTTWTTDVSTNNGDFGRDLAIDSNGKIVVSGSSLVGGTLNFSTARYNTNGSLDTSFSGDGKVTTAVGASNVWPNGSAIQTDNKVLVVGHSDSGGGDYDITVVRYNTDGSLDTSFHADGITQTPLRTGDDRGYDMAIHPDGKIVVSGASWDGANYDVAVVRYRPGGVLDCPVTVSLHPRGNCSVNAFTTASGCPSGHWDCVNDQTGNTNLFTGIDVQKQCARRE